MRKILLLNLMTVTFLLGMIDFLQTTAADDGVDAIAWVQDADLACSGVNLVDNSSFEGEFTSYIMPPPGHPDCQTWSVDQPNQYCERVRLASGWHPFWRSAPRPETWSNIQPEYAPSFPSEIPPRVRSGERSQHYFSFWSTHEAGLYQQIDVLPGGQYCFSSYGQAWSSRTTRPDYTSDPEDHGQLYQKVGIDPTGGTDWQSADVIWGAERMQYDAFGMFTVTAVAENDTITVFLWSRPNIPVKHNDVYWDDAALTLAQYAAVSSSRIGWMIDVDSPAPLTSTIQISVTEGISWQANWQPGGTISPTLSAASGSAAAPVEVTFNPIGLTNGVYTASLAIAFTPGYQGSARMLDLSLYVVDEVYPVYLPQILR